MLNKNSSQKVIKKLNIFLAGETDEKWLNGEKKSFFVIIKCFKRIYKDKQQQYKIILGYNYVSFFDDE